MGNALVRPSAGPLPVVAADCEPPGAGIYMETGRLTVSRWLRKVGDHPCPDSFSPNWPAESAFASGRSFHKRRTSTSLAGYRRREPAL